MANEDIKEFDENDAIEYINNYLSKKGKAQCDSDDLLLLLDAMYDYYEENDSFESVEDLDENIDDVVNHVSKAISKDPDNKIPREDVRDIILAEMEYEETLDF